MSTDKKITLDKIGHTRSSSAGSTSMIPTPPINEGSAVPFPCDLGGLYSSVPRKSLTTSSLETPVGRLPVSKRTSRVLVMPSVARITYSPEPHVTNITLITISRWSLLPSSIFFDSVGL